MVTQNSELKEKQRSEVKNLEKELKKDVDNILLELELKKSKSMHVF